MAEHYVSILGPNTVPDSSGNVFFEPFSIKATNDLWDYLVAIFNDTATRIGLRTRFVVPSNYVSAPKIRVVWSSTATAGDVEWDVDYRAVADGEGLDQATAQETVNQNATAPGTAHDKEETDLTLTAGNLAAGDDVQLELFRDGTDAGDTMAAAAVVHDVRFVYNDV